MTAAKPQSLADDAAALLAKLGVPFDHYHGALKACSPITGEIIAELAETSPDAAQDAIDRAHEAFLVWRNVPAPSSALMLRISTWTLKPR